MKCPGSVCSMLSRAALSILLLPGLATQTLAQNDDVRVVLPLQLDNAAPDQDFERVDPDDGKKEYDAAAICDLIASSADEHELPKPWFARLIWKESRFDINAVSPAGAQGIAQFMPATALRRKLRDPFDPGQAIPASAAYLAELRNIFGNLGLAAAAYNAGEERVSSWLVRGGYLPFETEDYVLSILGRPAETFRGQTTDDEQRPLRDDKPFAEACRNLPVARTSPALYAGADVPAWGVQLAGHFDRAVAVRQWERVRSRYARILGDLEPAIFQKRGSIGRRKIHVVQIGASERREASDLCNRLKLAGASCVVVRN